MARFDVYAHPDAVLRKKNPYLLDVQNDHLARIATRVVVPLRFAHQFDRPVNDLNPVFEIAGNQVVLELPVAPRMTAGNPRIDGIRMHLQRYRELAARGKWADAGKELEAVESAVKR